jgi:KipI family sensor histidine kinase inhibitor
MSGLPISIRELGDSTLLVQTGDAPAITASRAAATNQLARSLIDLTIPGVLDVVPSYCTILIEFDLLTTDIDDLIYMIETEAADIEEGDAHPRRIVTIPVLYGGEYGPDLIEAAAYLGMTPERIVELHSGGEYFVAAVGFSPGFGFLLGLPPELTIPRRSTPRVAVPAGSVATAGGQTGVYPMSTPGGWWLLGKTPAKLFDLRREQPFALEPGDGVRFDPIDQDTFHSMEAAAIVGDLVLPVSEVAS